MNKLYSIRLPKFTEYEELDEIKEALEEAGIKYEYQKKFESIFVFVDGLMQIRNPTTEDLNRYWPKVRIGRQFNIPGYHVKAGNKLYRRISFDEVIEIVKETIKG